jgi:hypothetical protein
MKITMLSAALAAVSLSQTVSAAAGSWLYTSKHRSDTTKSHIGRVSWKLKAEAKVHAVQDQQDSLQTLL